MKNSLKSLVLVAASALAIVSCRKSEIQESPVTEDEIFFTLTTANHLSDAEDQGKTYMEYDQADENYKPSWKKGDQIGVYFNNIITTEGNDRTGFDLSLTNSNNDGAVAQFTGTTTSTSIAQSGTIYAFYPNRITKADAKDGSVVFNIPATQHPTAKSFDPAADLLIAKPVGYTLSEGEKKTVTIENVQFARALAILRIKLYTSWSTAQGASITKLTVTSEGNTLGGQPKFDITKDNGASIVGYNSTSSSVSAKYDGVNAGAVVIATEKGETMAQDNLVFLMVAPGTLKKDDNLVFEGEIEGYTFRKESSLPKDIVLNPGQASDRFAVSLVEDNFEVKEPETRLYVEGFDECNITSGGKQYKPFAGEGIQYGGTGVFGLGVEEGVLDYVYSAVNCNIRKGSGKSSEDPYLYINGVGEYFRIQKLNVPEDMQLKFSAWIKNNGTLTVKIKPSESGDEDWEELGNIVLSNNTDGASYSIISTDTYSEGQYDFELNYSVKQSTQLYVDDIVIEKDPRAILETPVVDVQIDDRYKNKINVTWGAIEHAGSYEVTLQKEGAINFVVETTETNSISFSDLDFETKYDVKVKAISSDITLYKDSADSEWKEITTGVEGVEWKAKSFADLKDGDEVVVVGIRTTEGDSYALADNHTGATDPVAVQVTFTNDMLDEAPADNLIWVVGVSGESNENRIFYTDGNKNEWLYCTTDKARIGTTADNTFVWDQEYMKNVVKATYIGVQKSDPSIWRATTTTPSKSTLIKEQTFKFFVKDDPRTQLTTPEITVTPDSQNKAISVSWVQVPNAAEYTVTCTGQGNQTVTLTSCEFTELVPGEYTVTVTAKAQPGSSYSDSKAASKTVAIEDTTPVISYTAPETAEASDTSIEFAYEVTWPRDNVELEVTKVDETVDWITELSVDSENKKVSVTLTENTSDVARQAKLTLSYSGATNKTVTINQNGAVSKVYASLAELVDDGKPTTTGTTVTVTLTDDEISKISSGKNLFFMVNGQEIEIYGPSVYPNTWGTVAVGGKISGTITCPWKLYVYEQSGDEVWELTPADWTGLSYTAPLEPCATPVITISDQGSATITCATAGATIYYAVGDNQPTEFTDEYTGAVTLTDGQTIWAQAKKDGFNKPSAVVSKTYNAGSQPINLTFGFTSNPGEWPTDEETVLTGHTYMLGGTNYTFMLKNVRFSKSYLMLTKPAVLGLPAIDGKKLTKVVVKNSSGCSMSTNVGISSSSESASYVSGGDAQTFATRSSTYTYNLNGTDGNTMYYLYVTSQNAQIIELTLTYE